MPAARPQVGYHLAIHEQLHLGGDAGDRIYQPSSVVQPDTGRTSFGVGKERGAGGVLRLAEVVLRHHPPRGGKATPQLGGVILGEPHLAACGGADRLPGEVVLGGADPSGDDHGVRPFQRLADGRGDPVDVVAHRYLNVGVESGVGQRPADEGGIAVDDLAKQQLGPDGDDLDDHLMPASGSTQVAASKPDERTVEVVEGHLVERGHHQLLVADPLDPLQGCPAPVPATANSGPQSPSSTATPANNPPGLGATRANRSDNALSVGGEHMHHEPVALPDHLEHIAPLGQREDQAGPVPPRPPGWKRPWSRNARRVPPR